MKSKYILGAVAAVLLLAALVYFYGGGQAPSGQQPLENLTAQNIADVKTQFNAAKGEIRVLLFLSPT